MRRSCLLLALLLSLTRGGAGSSFADDYPSQPIQIIVPFGAGGGTDSFARIIEQGIEEHRLLSQPIVIRNIGGAGATIGSRVAKDAPPDGHTVLVLHNAIITAKLTDLVDYGPEAFEVVAATGFVGQVVAVRDVPSAPRTLDELMQRARERPGVLRWTCNLGALTHFSGLQLQQTEKAAGARFNFVPSGGGADRYAALKGGHADVTGFSLEEYLRYKPDGLRGLCFLGAERYPGLDLPTAVELGYTAAERDNLFYWWMPKGTPPDRIEKFADVLERVMQLPDVRRKLEKGLIDPVFIRGPELHERLREAEERNARIEVPPNYELPDFAMILLVCVVLLAAVAIVESIGSRRRTPRLSTDDATLSVTSAAPPIDGVPVRSRVDLAIGTVVIVTVYVAVLSGSLVDFRIATFLFMLVAGAILVGRRPGMLAGLAGIALVTSLGLHTTFTRLFEIVLP